MARNFFQLIKQSSRYETIYQEKMREIYDFIQVYWKEYDERSN